MDDRKVKLQEIADILKISKGTVFNILHEHLGMKKLFSKLVPRLLTMEQKQQRVVESERCLDLFERDKKNFLRRYVTMDETWITTRQSQKDRLLSGDLKTKAAQSVQRLNNRPARLWRLFFGMRKEYCSSTI